MKRTSNKNNYCVYVHINKINGKMYVGQTCNIKERWRCHGKNYFACVKFFNALKKYGWDNFIHEVIKDGLCKEEANILEKELIATFDTIKTGYNLKEGGARGKLSPESLKKMGDGVHRAFTERPEIIEKIRQAHLGKKVPKEVTQQAVLHNPRAIFVDINGENGTIRYWARRLNISHIPLLYRKNRYGMDIMIQYIKDELSKTA